MLLCVLLRLCSAILEPVLFAWVSIGVNYTTPCAYIDLVQRDVQGLREAFLYIRIGLVLLLVMGFQNVMLLLCKPRLDVTRDWSREVRIQVWSIWLVLSIRRNTAEVLDGWSPGNVFSRFLGSRVTREVDIFHQSPPRLPLSIRVYLLFVAMVLSRTADVANVGRWE